MAGSELEQGLRISVVVPVYKSAATIVACVESLLRQTHPADEIIVVDDASPDRSMASLQGFNVKCVHLRVNGGAAVARAEGVRRATGEIVAFLDADCIAPADWAATIRDAFRQDAELGGMGGGYRHRRARSLIEFAANLEEEYFHHVAAKSPEASDPPGGNCAFRKSVWERGSSGQELLLFRGMASGEDTFVCHQLRKVAKIRFFPTCTVLHQPVAQKSYFRRHISRGKSRAILARQRLTSSSDLAFRGYGGWRVIGASAALAAVLLSLPFLWWWPRLAGGVAAVCWVLHLGLARPYLRFAKRVPPDLPEGRGLHFPQMFWLRWALLARTGCWVWGALQAVVGRWALRGKIGWNVVCSVLHFWRPGRISRLFFFVTSACNARCAFCFNLENVVNWKARKSVELSLEEVRKIARHLKRLPYLTLSGGEPFIREDLPELIETFYRECHTQWVTIPSNASLTKRVVEWTQEILRRCPGLFLTVQVSMDSMYEDHDKSRKIGGGFAAMTETLKRLACLRQVHKNLRIQIATCYDDFNVARIQEMIDYCRAHFGYDQQLFYLIRDKGKRITQSNNHLVPSFVQTLVDNERREWKQHRKTLWHRTVRALQGVTYADIAAIKLEQRFIRPCHATRKFVTLYDNGQISPCEVLDAVNLGNVRDFEYDFYELIRRKEAAQFYAKEIREKQCNCDWMCATPMNMLYDLKTLPRIAKGFLRPGAFLQPHKGQPHPLD